VAGVVLHMTAPGNATTPALIQPGDIVVLDHEPDCILPGGVELIVSAANADGSFRCGGNTSVWPRRIVAIWRKDSPAEEAPRCC
jgi:hypothetical protein